MLSSSVSATAQRAMQSSTRRTLHKLRHSQPCLQHHTTFSATSSTKTSQPSSSNSNSHVIKHSIAKPSIPALGFGTWGVDNFSHDVMAKAVDMALKAGYTHLDCARVYGNEKEIGQVIADNLANGVIRREDLFVTSKVFNHEWNAVSAALESSLKDLQLEYVDAFLIHWPFQNTPNMQGARIPYAVEPLYATHQQLYELEVKGLTRSIGICNASMKKMKELNVLCDRDKISRPGILQNEIHPYFQQKELLRFCQQEEIVLTGFMPLGSPERPARSRRDNDPVVMQDAELHAISQECGYSVAQVIIRWHLQRGTVCIPKATEDWMIKQNLETLEFSLSDDQMKRIDALDKNFRFHRGEFLAWNDNMEWQELWDNE
eukprot:CAMPEP_0197028238 /NCGR_PEP_ID=MMETSP1384-20130603/7966_1 /TAXON_ID=29189 /ORGANISM="Ammonia sp." /LENGTH=373 /DNA_ID=CAMNT_0042457207 /DNA_START=26 /DNA_END=1147 /DNA_ORIENTATION=-